MLDVYSRWRKRLGVDINRKTWIKNWRTKVLWELYCDYQIIDVEARVKNYCLKERIDYSIDGGWFLCVSDRRQFNDIMKLINDVIFESEED